MPSSDKPTEKHSITDIVVRDMSSVKANPGANYTPKGGQSTRVAGQNIVTIEMPKEQAVHTFEPGRLHDTKGLKYSDVVKSIPEGRAASSSRFRINELTRGPLSVEAEEEERIETEVQARLAARLEEMREQVRSEAYDAGFNSGRQEARAEVLAVAQPKIDAFMQMVGEFESMKTAIFKANEQFLLHMINQIAESVILRELKDDADYVKRLALSLLERIGTRENVKIFIGEAEQNAIEALKAGLAQTLGELKNISVEVDSSITHGGCRVETEFGEIDARINTQIQNIAAGLGVDKP